MIDKIGYDYFGRPCKELYFINLAFDVSLRSLDPDTKCGCIITDEEDGIISTGYNGPIRKSIDENVPLERPEKYFYMEHSERNAIYIAAKNGSKLKNSIFYVTGLPCIDCLRGIVQVGAKKIIYGPLTAKMTSDEKYIARYKEILVAKQLKILRFKYDEQLFELNPKVKKIIENINDRISVDFEIL